MCHLQVNAHGWYLKMEGKVLKVTGMKGYAFRTTKNFVNN